jgi:hypothetical protein
MGYEIDLLNGLRVIEPVSASDNAWAKAALSELMEEYNLSRDKAMELAKKHAPTVYRWLQGE